MYKYDLALHNLYGLIYHKIQPTKQPTNQDVQVLMLIIFTNPSARAGYDTRSIFKQSLTGLNSEFFFA